MTATVNRPNQHSADLIESSEPEVRLAVNRALARAGMTYDQLQEQARHNDFQSMAARTAWIAVRDLREFTE